MNGKIKKLKDGTGKDIYPVTRGEAVFVEDNKTLNQKLTELGSTGDGHTHTNKTTLDKLSESSGALTFNGSTVGGSGTATVGTKEPTVKPLYLPASEGYYDQYHPSVVYIANGWNGYEFWMATTPYPFLTAPDNNGEPFENPHMYCSHDGYDWKVPEGVVNPLDNQAKSGAFYLSDTHLFHRPDTNVMELWYRVSGGAAGGTNIIRLITSDGFKTFTREEIIRQNDPTASGIKLADGTGLIVRSQAVIWDNTNKIYNMWFNTNDGAESIYYAESSDAKAWTGLTKVTLNGMAHTPWHLDVAFYSGTQKYYLTSFTKANALYLFDGTSKTTLTYQKTLLAGADGRGDDFFRNLYRSILVRVGATGGEWRLYYSGYDENKKYAGIGVMAGQLLELKHVAGHYHTAKQGFHNGIEVVNTSVKSSPIQCFDTGEGFGFDYATKEPYWLKSDGTKIYFTR